MPAKLLEYTVIDENSYPGQGHIINIAKRHTNRRWRQYTPQKECIILLELKKLCHIDSIQLKGFGTYIVEISFKDVNNQLATKLKYNFDFFDESINEKIMCQKDIKFVAVKLVNSEQSPKRMGLNHFFMRGQAIKKNQQQSDQQVKKRKRRQPTQVWVRQKTQDDVWGLDQVQDQQNGDNTKAENKLFQIPGSTPKKRGGKKKTPQAIQLEQKQAQIKINAAKRQQSSAVKNQVKISQQMSKPKKKVKQHPQTQIKLQNNKATTEILSNKIPLQNPNKIQLQIQKSENKTASKPLYSQKFEQKFKLKDQKKEIVQEPKSSNQAEMKQTQQQKKQRIKKQLIQKLKAAKAKKQQGQPAKNLITTAQ